MQLGESGVKPSVTFVAAAFRPSRLRAEAFLARRSACLLRISEAALPFGERAL